MTTWMCYLTSWLSGPKPIWLDASKDRFSIGNPETNNSMMIGFYTVDDEHGSFPQANWQFDSDPNITRTTFPQAYFGWGDNEP